MALLRSRTYLGTIQGIVGNTHVGFYLAPHTLLRRNASTATTRLKIVPKTTGKGKAAQTPSPNTTRKSPKSPSSPVQNKQSPATPKINSGTKPPTPENAAEPEKTATGTDSKTYQDMTEEERERELQRMLQMSELMPTMDLFGQEIESTLDVMIPYPKRKSLSFTRKGLQHFKSNIQNYLKNAMALNMLSAFDAIPGVWKSGGSRWSRIRHKFRVFGVQSTRPDGLIAPFRQIVLELYEEFNMAVASRTERDIKKLTTWDYQKHALGVMKTSLKNNPNGRLLWQLHRVVEPVQFLSLRVTQGHFGTVGPKFGNRLLVHALVKFDTEQSLEIYDYRGRPLHPPAEPEKTPVFIDADKKPEKWRVPAVKKRVQEYIVFEKRMWVQGPWLIREQMWPTWPLEEAQESKK